MSAPKLTREQIEEALRLREQRGWSYERIGRRFDVTGSCIQWHCLRLGADSPGAKPPPQTARGPSQHVRCDGVIVRRFTPDEDVRLNALAAQGLSPSEIGRQLNRKHNVVIMRLLSLARQAERTEAAAARGGATP